VEIVESFAAVGCEEEVTVLRQICLNAEALVLFFSFLLITNKEAEGSLFIFYFNSSLLIFHSAHCDS